MRTSTVLAALAACVLATSAPAYAASAEQAAAVSDGAVVEESYGYNTAIFGGTDSGAIDDTMLMRHDDLALPDGGLILVISAIDSYDEVTIIDGMDAAIDDQLMRTTLTDHAAGGSENSGAIDDLAITPAASGHMDTA